MPARSSKDCSSAILLPMLRLERYCACCHHSFSNASTPTISWTEFGKPSKRWTKPGLRDRIDYAGDLSAYLKIFYKPLGLFFVTEITIELVCVDSLNTAGNRKPYTALPDRFGLRFSDQFVANPLSAAFFKHAESHDRAYSSLFMKRGF